MTSTDHAFEMAETLIVLAGDNAWAAARSFGATLALEGKPELARQWRNVARAVLRKLTGAMASPAVLTIKPEFVGETLSAPQTTLLALPAPMPAVPAISIEPEIIGSAPIPLRARRQLALLAGELAAQPADADAFAFAKAA